MVNGIDELAITNTDGLDTVEDNPRLHRATRWVARNGRTTCPTTLEDLAQLPVPIYAEFPGWEHADARGCAKWKKIFPQSAKRYLKAIVGADRREDWPLLPSAPGESRRFSV